MEYRLLSNPEHIRNLFIKEFVESYESFSIHHEEWIAGLHTEFSREYYDKMFMWDRKLQSARNISFVDALTVLKNKTGEVLFLTESSQCPVKEFCKLNNKEQFVATASAKELAECISYEWFTEYELCEKDCYLSDPILPSEVYVFDDSFTWCLIFTHETDETETADSRFCLYIDKTAPNQ